MRKFRVDYVRGYNCFYSEGDYLTEDVMVHHRYMKDGMTIVEINNWCMWYRFSEVE
jgi:hypothetical protein